MDADRSCTSYNYIYIKTNYLISLIKASSNGTIRCKTVKHGRCSLCGQGILKYKSRLVNWKYVTVDVGR